MILTNVSCADSREEAHERALQYLGAKWDSIDDHYNFSDGHLANVKGYESYGKTAKTYAKMKDPGGAQEDDGLLCQQSRSWARRTTACSRWASCRS